MTYAPHRGFSLIELMVSIAIFSIVVLAAMSAYLTLISLDRRARAINQTANNLSFAIDAMGRGIRTGTNFRCLNGGPDGNGNSTNGDCTQFCYVDSVLPAGSNYVTYFLKTNGTIGRTESGSCTTLDASAYPLTDPSITITKIVFYVRGAGNTNDAQPNVVFTVQGTLPADSKGAKATFSIEESATQRIIDI